MEYIKDIGDALPEEPKPQEEPKLLPYDLRRRIWQEYETEQNARLVPYKDRYEEAERQNERSREALAEAQIRLMLHPDDHNRWIAEKVVSDFEDAAHQAGVEAHAASTAYHEMMRIIRRKINLRSKIMRQKDEKPF